MRDITYHCEGPDCTTHIASAARRAPVRGFIEVRENVGDDILVHDFCSWDCVMKFAAKIDAPLELDIGGVT